MIKEFIKENIDFNKLKRVFFYTFFIGIIAYGYIYFNANFSHDSMTFLYDTNQDMYISVGRIARPIYQMIKGKNSLPVINGFLFLLFVSFSNYLIIETIEIEKKISEFFICSIMTVNYSTSLLNATYIHDLDADAFSLLCVCLSVWIINKYNKKIFAYIISILLFVFSLGLYQSYIEVAISIFLILAIIKTIKGHDIKEILLNTFKQFVIIGISMLAYYLLFKLSTSIFEISSSNYHNPSEALNINFSNLNESIIAALKSLQIWYQFPRNYNVLLIGALNYALTLLLIIILLLIFIKNKMCIKHILFTILLIVLIPLGSSSIQFISKTSHELTAYSYFLMYVLIIKMIELYNEKYESSIFKKIINFLLVLSMMCFSFDNVLYSNALSLKKELEEQETLSVFTRIIDRIEQIDGYKVGKTKVLFIGNIKDSVLVDDREGFNFSGIGVNNDIAVVRPISLNAYFKEYLGYPINIVDIEETNIDVESEDIMQMSCFPYNGCIKKYDDVLVIKLSDN